MLIPVPLEGVREEWVVKKAKYSLKNSHFLVRIFVIVVPTSSLGKEMEESMK